MRVGSEVLAYQGLLQSAWSWLPVSAVIEMIAVTLFALNLFVTFIKKPTSPPILKMRAEDVVSAIH